jgi:hypothetical protein
MARWESKARSWDDIEGVHQMRVNCRRMRAALRSFRSAMPNGVSASWTDEPAWLAGRLGCQTISRLVTKRRSMELADAIKRLIPLQVQIPDPKSPLQLHAVPAAEVFLVETERGAAVVWLDLFWCASAPGNRAPTVDAAQTDRTAGRCHIAYAVPRPQSGVDRWVDDDPSFGPRCIAWQKPFVIERLNARSEGWRHYRDWRSQQPSYGSAGGRHAAWRHAESVFGDLIRARVV